MPSRTTDAYVKSILAGGVDYDTSSAPDLTPYLNAAYFIANRMTACASRKGLSYDADLLAEIEAWLVAHSFKTSDQQYASRSTMNASGSFGGQRGLMLELTTYGQQAMLMDPYGCLEAINKGAAVDLQWLGKNPTGQIDYTDRR